MTLLFLKETQKPRENAGIQFCPSGALFWKSTSACVFRNGHWRIIWGHVRQQMLGGYPAARASPPLLTLAHRAMQNPVHWNCVRQSLGPSEWSGCWGPGSSCIRASLGYRQGCVFPLTQSGGERVADSEGTGWWCSISFLANQEPAKPTSVASSGVRGCLAGGRDSHWPASPPS